MTPAELGKMTKAQLIELASKKKINVTAKMLKAELVKVISAGLKAGAKKAKGKKPAATKKVAAKAKPGTRVRAKRKTTTKKSAKPATMAKAKRKPSAPRGSKMVPAGSKSPARGSKSATRGKKSVKSRLSAASSLDDRTIRQKAVAGKYHLTTGPLKLPPVESMDIPSGYDRDHIAMMVRDPWWLFSYWEITEATLNKLEKKFEEDWSSCKMILRIFDRTSNRKTFFDVEPGYGPRSWYVNVSPGRTWQTAIGLMGPNGKFIQIAVSNLIETPRDSVSDVIDDRYLVPDEVFEKIFAASGGYSRESSTQKGSEELAVGLRRELLEEMGSETVSSFGSAGLQKGKKKRGFRLWVATELILYGATEPDARVTIQGKEIKLRGDGTFSARFALPDGAIDIPVVAVSGDGIEEREIDTTVKKKSKSKEPVIR
ncbi:MAG: DUF4912 domain-containing protein [Bacteroidales bacterium]|nr:DUF4912 domain-containing protein [Candidatus Latescibacterota bacterium]